MRLKKRVALLIDYVETEYSQRLVRGTSDYLSKHNAELVVFPSGTINAVNFSYNYQYLAVASHITPQNVDGIIFMTGSHLNNVTPEYMHSYLKSFAPVPVVSIGYKFDDIPSVVSSCAGSMYDLVSHIITTHGRRKIALMGVEGNSQEVSDRKSAFLNTLKQFSVEFDPSREIYGGFTYDTARFALRSYLSKKGKFDFDAIVALNDEMAFACLDIFKENGISVPEDIVVTGFDDEIRSSYVTPTLSTVNQNVEQQAYSAAEILLNIIEGKDTVLSVKVPSEAVFRQSCGCVPPGAHECEGIDVRGKSVVANSELKVFDISQWYDNRNQFVQVIQLFSDIQVDISIDVLRSRIKSDLSGFGIKSAAVCLFSKPVETDRFEYFPLPPGANVFCAFDKDNCFSLTGDSITFDPRKTMVPEGIFASLDGMYVCSLYRASVLYGYIIYRPGSYDITVYSMVCKLLSSSIASAVSVSAARQRQSKLQKEYDAACAVSVTDDMTGLLNRRGFMSLGTKALENAFLSGTSGLVLFGDMDGLKKINDTYGHSAGDRAIKAEARILKEAFRSSDILGRLGGDEFAIIASGLGEERFQEIKTTLDSKCEEYNRTSGEPYVLSLSMGYSVFHPLMREYDIKILLELADEALYEEKNHKKSLCR